MAIINILYECYGMLIPEKKVEKITVISQATKNELLKVVKCDPKKIEVHI